MAKVKKYLTKLNPFNTKSENYFNKTFNKIEILGEGSFGKVYHVENKATHRIYAVKEILFKDLDSKEQSDMVNEIDKLIRVQSEYVVQYVDSWDNNKKNNKRIIYIQMEMYNYSLSNIIKGKAIAFERQIGHPMGLIEYLVSCELFKQVLECVKHLHELNPQIIHRDLKPDNILIAVNGRNGRFVKLCDFGLATVHDKRVNYRLSHKHTADVGDMRYHAPEVGLGQIYGHRSDIYSLGLIGGELFDMNVLLIDLEKY
ncbi:unnamed protein product [Oppiella nova]|uniref:Protein kinase domain-containing protein n=1 Tax=Oppiella nova TaxID=334625 RepID=A0A7R9M4Q1_9ACAR|nr:unnamed protein product [Oppiella nova]CAG2170706.1 unnamed protein product [Oppiella nova]